VEDEPTYEIVAEVAEGADYDELNEELDAFLESRTDVVGFEVDPKGDEFEAVAYATLAAGADPAELERALQERLGARAKSLTIAAV
jgi:hypothetical protein